MWTWAEHHPVLLFLLVNNVLFWVTAWIEMISKAIRRRSPNPNAN